MRRIFLLSVTHIAVALAGFAAGVYFLPILVAPSAPAGEEIRAQAQMAEFTGQFRPDLEGSDAVHWGEGMVYVGRDAIAFDGTIAPGPDYKLYLSPVFVETEEDFIRRKRDMMLVGDVRTFKKFIVPVPDSVDLSRFNTVVVWCESFGQFITAARYR